MNRSEEHPAWKQAEITGRLYPVGPRIKPTKKTVADFSKVKFEGTWFNFGEKEEIQELFEEVQRLFG